MYKASLLYDFFDEFSGFPVEKKLSYSLQTRKIKEEAFFYYNKISILAKTDQGQILVVTQATL